MRATIKFVSYIEIIPFGSYKKKDFSVSGQKRRGHYLWGQWLCFKIEWQREYKFEWQ